jgi:hypothetical protein
MMTYRVFEMNDCGWWLAQTSSDAERDYRDTYGQYALIHPEGARELSDGDLGRLIFFDDLSDQTKSGKRTFREELDRRLAAGVNSPEPFASTEY